ncbi:deoxyribose-phosphate aldolase isoform X2 [Chelonoidis abingdonii]|uniref:deoxyribose-phosphate aldolase isoform X2 n=1 Tax=Chelonoidis abingdonii TaxID=106734 RepID=UPI0013F2A27F|nr:deoxyribose-phosphate aldolase isoform X2 [Chelonoidis abingdonii]
MPTATHECIMEAGKELTGCPCLQPAMQGWTITGGRAFPKLSFRAEGSDLSVVGSAELRHQAPPSLGGGAKEPPRPGSVFPVRRGARGGSKGLSRGVPRKYRTQPGDVLLVLIMSARNPGTELDLGSISRVQVNQPAVIRHAEQIQSRRTVKKDWQAAWLLRAVTCIDLTTLSGDDTPSNIHRLCYKAKHPIREDLLRAMNMHDKGLYEEIRQFRQACGDAHMKTILATGELGSLTNVYKASMVAMMAGSDFIKTSTGKEAVNATLPVGIVMMRAIRDFYWKTGNKVGFKPAGGIRTAKDALTWLILMKEELGDEWLKSDLFRLGASTLLSDIERQIYHHVTGRYAAYHDLPMA